MDSVIVGIIVTLWVSIGFGVRNLLFKARMDWMAEFPLIPFLWPVVLLIAALVPKWGESK